MKNIEPTYVLFGNRVQQIRSALGLTQQELANRTEMDRTSIAKIETGSQRILLHEVETFSKAFGMTPGKLIKGIWL